MNRRFRLAIMLVLAALLLSPVIGDSTATGLGQSAEVRLHSLLDSPQAQPPIEPPDLYASAPKPDAKKLDPKLESLLKKVRSRSEKGLLAAYRLRQIAGSSPELKAKIDFLFETAAKRTTRKEKKANLMLALIALGGDGPAKAHELLGKAKAKDRPYLIQAYSRAGDRAVEMLRKVLGGDSIQEARLAAKLLADFGPKAAPAIPELRKRAKEWTRSLDGVFVVTLGEIGPAAKVAIPEIMSVLKDESTRVENFYVGKMPDCRLIFKSDAARALVSLGAPAVEPLIKALKKKKGKTRFIALMTLAAMGETTGDATTAIIKIAKDTAAANGSDKQRRLAAAATAALGRLGPKGIAQLGRLLARTKARDDDSYHAAGFNQGVRNAGAGLKKHLGSMFKYLSTRKPGPVNEHFLWAIEQMGSEIIAPLRVVFKSSKSFNAKLHAAAALGRFGPEAKDALGELMRFHRKLKRFLGQAGYLETMGAVAGAVARIKPESPKVCEALCKTFLAHGSRANQERYQTLRRQLLEALSLTTGATEAHVAILKKAWKKVEEGDRNILRNRDYYLLVRALDATGRQNASVTKLLKEQASDASTPRVRMEATLALLRREVWTPQALVLIKKMHQHKMDISALCDTLATSSIAADHAKELYKAVRRLPLLERGRPAYMLVQVDSEAIDNTLFGLVTGAFTTRRPRDAKEAKRHDANIKWVVKFLTKTAHRFELSKGVTEATVLLLSRPEYRADALAILRTAAQRDPKCLAHFTILRASTMDATVEAALTSLIDGKNTNKEK